MNKFIFIISLSLLFFITGSHLLPSRKEMFLAHDETQAARIHQFNVNIENGIVPPRIAPDFSFGLGYPVFNYYAPFPYWIAQLFVSSGSSVIVAMKLTYLLAILCGYIGMFFFLKKIFPFVASLIGAFIYATSPYIAVDIFVRGNLGETWIFALLPWALYMLLTNSKKRLILTAFTLSFLFTAHNILSLISLGIIIIFISLIQKKIINSISIISGLLLSSYFLIPAVLEISFVQARTIATKTQYADHFLCLSQIWTSVWGYAGSTAGCEADGMSFMLGKIPILLGVFGILFFLYNRFIYKENRFTAILNNLIRSLIQVINRIHPLIKQDISLDQSEIHRISLFILALALGSIYMTLYASAWLWRIFEPILSLFQFPWRFLMFALFGFSFFSAYLIAQGTKYTRLITTVGIMLLLLLIHHKYFQGQLISEVEFNKKYLSKEYIHNSVAYKVPEYIPVHVDYKEWKKAENEPQRLNKSSEITLSTKQDTQLEIENTPFSKIFMAKSSEPIIAAIHYAPYWKITVDGKYIIPSTFDSFGRPLLDVKDNDFSTIQIAYEQTDVETFANLLTLLTSGILIAFTVKQFTSSWSTIIKKT